VGIGLLDVGAPLQAFIAYSDMEKALFYLDHCYPLGASASSNAGQICNAAVDIWQAEVDRETVIKKYEDDIPVVQT
jgi:kynureninase